MDKYLYSIEWSQLDDPGDYDDPEEDDYDE